MNCTGVSGTFGEGEPPCEPSADAGSDRAPHRYQPSANAGSDGASPFPRPHCQPHGAEYGVAGQGMKPSARRDDAGETDFEEGFSVMASESIRQGCEKVRLARAERLRKLNEEARREAEQAMAARRLRHGGCKEAKPKRPGQDAVSAHTGRSRIT
jgi:hypothetical protein